VLRAIDNPHVDIFFHPTGRIINRRPAIDIDIDKVIDLAKKTKTVMEVNSFPERSDLKDEHVRKCVELGVKLAIDSDGTFDSSHFALLRKWHCHRPPRVGGKERCDQCMAYGENAELFERSLI
jgi:DNA polymerase (family 10)